MVFQIDKQFNKSMKNAKKIIDLQISFFFFFTIHNHPYFIKILIFFTILICYQSLEKLFNRSSYKNYKHTAYTFKIEFNIVHIYMITICKGKYCRTEIIRTLLIRNSN